MHYRPLNEATNEIRVITLLPSPNGQVRTTLQSGTDHIICRLEHVSLNEITSHGHKISSLATTLGRFSKIFHWEDAAKPVESGGKRTSGKAGNFAPRYRWGDYAALSYTWGDPSDTSDVVLNGVIVKVSRNLEEALRMLRDSDELCDRRLWVDALCINQNDLSERGHQVKRMKDIFGGASKVIVWTGPAADESHKVVELVDTLWIALHNSNGNPSQSQIIAGQPLGDGFWKAYFHLISRPYWRRVWIIQELVMAPKGMRIYFGGMSLPLDRICWLGDLIDQNGDLFDDLMRREVGAAYVIGNRVYMYRLLQIVEEGNSGSRSVNIYRLVKHSYRAKATNERDKVYGILGLIQEPILSLITPDYNLPASEVFATFTRAVIEGSQSLDIIRYGYQLSEQRMLSWVPDSGSERSAAKKPQFNAHGGSIARAGFLANHTVLSCKGILFDIIDGLSSRRTPTSSRVPRVFPSVSSNNPYGDKHNLAKALWTTLIDTMGGALPVSLNLLNIPWNFQPNQTPIQGESWRLLTNRPWYQEFETFRQMNKSFLFGGIPFQEFFPSTSKSLDNLPKMIFALDRFSSVMSSRRMMTTSRGYIGRAHKDARPGDVIYVLLGCSDPLILRPSGEYFEIVGICYVYGIMQGEIFEMVERGEKEIVDVKIL